MLSWCLRHHHHQLQQHCNRPPGVVWRTILLVIIAQVLDWLPTDPLMGGLIPESPRGGLQSHIQKERCKFGPFTFGGGRNYPLGFMDAGSAGRCSQRQYLKGKSRDRIGGSTTHMDGERAGGGYMCWCWCWCWWLCR